MSKENNPPPKRWEKKIVKTEDRHTKDSAIDCNTTRPQGAVWRRQLPPPGQKIRKKENKKEDG